MIKLFNSVFFSYLLFNSSIIFAQPLEYKIIKVELNNGQKYESTKAIIYKDAILLEIYKKDISSSNQRRASQITVNLTSLKSLRYSNKNRRYQGILLGILTGTALAATSEGYTVLAWIIATPVLVLFGGAIGGSIYTDWQEFDLSPYRKEKLSLGLKPMRGGIGIGLRILLRR